MKIFKTILIFSSLSIVNIVQAGTCEIHYTRAACTGQEAISYKKCNGTPSCDEFLELATSAECQAAADKACENQRITITKSKVITAKFDNVALKNTAGGDDFCLTYAKRDVEFDQCDKK